MILSFAISKIENRNADVVLSFPKFLNGSASTGNIRAQQFEMSFCHGWDFSLKYGMYHTKILYFTPAKLKLE